MYTCINAQSSLQNQNKKQRLASSIVHRAAAGVCECVCAHIYPTVRLDLQDTFGVVSG